MSKRRQSILIRQVGEGETLVSIPRSHFRSSSPLLSSPPPLLSSFSEDRAPGFLIGTFSLPTPAELNNFFSKEVMTFPQWRSLLSLLWFFFPLRSYRLNNIRRILYFPHGKFFMNLILIPRTFERMWKRGEFWRDAHCLSVFFFSLFFLKKNILAH